MFLTHAQHVQVALRLSRWEQWCWILGAKLPADEMARRIFAFVDENHSESVSISAMDGLVRLLQIELTLTKASFDLVEACSLLQLPLQRPAVSESHLFCP